MRCREELGGQKLIEEEEVSEWGAYVAPQPYTVLDGLLVFHMGPMSWGQKVGAGRGKNM